MPAIPRDYVERVYAGLIGKNVGIRLGAPVEPAFWTYEKIREIYGDVRAYLKPYRNFAADDDANGPVFFIRPLLEGDPARPLEAMDVERAWLDYAREGVGMFWWGGYGRSTEHTAYLNMKTGIHAPESGSARRNGLVVSEQIGGQIFSDSWGLVWPGRPDMAAAYAATAASVSHDGEALYGARFVAACIAAAFAHPDGGMRALVEAGLGQIPALSQYGRVARAVIGFHETRPGDWQACMEYLIAEWGYDRWPGLCHVIPNAGVCVLALLYGDGDFSRIVEIATMCGWDTDCNAGNVGTIAGVYYGLEAIPPRYRDPINDGIVLSGLPGSLNILDLPTFSRRLAILGYRLGGDAAPDAASAAIKEGDGELAIFFDFALPGSTHGLRVSNPTAFAVKHRRSAELKDREGQGQRKGGEGGVLEFRYERLERGMRGKLFYKPFYRRADFDDERYSPTFAPIARPGQSVAMVFELERWEGEKIAVEGYVRETYSGREIATTTPIFPEPGNEYRLEFAIPQVGGSQIDEIGLSLTGLSGAKKRDSGRLLVKSLSVRGKSRYSIDISKQFIEFGCVTPFSHDGGFWSIEEGRMQLFSHSQAAAYTGGYAVGDQGVSARVKPLAGTSHLLLVRASGAMRGYWAGFDGPGRLSIFKNDFGFSLLASTSFVWELGSDYDMRFEALGESLILSIGGRAVLEAKDGSHERGMVGCATLGAARALYGPFEIEEL